MIGKLQRNKVKDALKFLIIFTLDNSLQTVYQI